MSPWRERTIEGVTGRGDATPHDRHYLDYLSEALSLDFAALYFVSALYDDPTNRRVQDAFHKRLTALKERSAPPNLDADSYLIAFVPGYGYRRNPGTGADFARQRAVLDEIGVRTALIQTNEIGTVEENADIIAEAVRGFRETDYDVILVSTSKAGPETGLALGDRLAPSECMHVKAWVSIGGLLRGSPYADYLLKPWRRWAVYVVGGLRGRPVGLLKNLTTEVRRPAFERVDLPDHLLTLQYVGVPLSGHIGPAVEGRHKIIRPLGPNDGLTLVADELIEGGLAVTAVGLDHYYRHPDIDLVTVALLQVVNDELNAADR